MADTGNILGALSNESDNYQAFLNRGAATMQNFDTEEMMHDQLTQAYKTGKELSYEAGRQILGHEAMATLEAGITLKPLAEKIIKGGYRGIKAFKSSQAYDDITGGEDFPQNLISKVKEKMGIPEDLPSGPEAPIQMKEIGEQDFDSIPPEPTDTIEPARPPADEEFGDTPEIQPARPSQPTEPTEPTEPSEPPVEETQAPKTGLFEDEPLFEDSPFSMPRTLQQGGGIRPAQAPIEEVQRTEPPGQGSSAEEITERQAAEANQQGAQEIDNVNQQFQSAQAQRQAEIQTDAEQYSKETGQDVTPEELEKGDAPEEVASEEAGEALGEGAAAEAAEAAGSLIPGVGELLGAGLGIYGLVNIFSHSSKPSPPPPPPPLPPAPHLQDLSYYSAPVIDSAAFHSL